MSPILLRPIREQFEHNRMIRLLQTRLRRRYLVGVNIEDEREATGVRSGAALVYPDLVLTSIRGARRLHGIVEVETTESVNHLEAMAEWVHFGKVRGTFYLYVPAGTTDIAQSLCERYGIAVTEIWSYHAVGDQMRFTMTHRSTRAASRAAAAARRVTKAGKKTAKGAKRGGTAKRAVTSTPQNAKKARRSPTAAKRTSKTAKRSPKTVRRATTTAKRAAKTVGRTAKTAKRKTGARSGRSAAKTAVAKATSTPSRTTKKTVKGAKRRVASGGKISSRASTSASRSTSKARRRSTAAGIQKTAASRRLRKQR